MVQPQKEPLRALSEQEERELRRIVKASSERLDVSRRAKALLAVAGGQRFTEAARQADLKSGDGVGKLVKRFNEHGLSALSIAGGRGRKPTYTSEQQGRIQDARAASTGSKRGSDGDLVALNAAAGTAQDGAAPHCQRNHSPGAACVRIQLSADTHLVPHGLRAAQTQKRHRDDLRRADAGKKRLIELACEQAEAAGIVQLNEDEAGPYQAIPQPGASWQPEGKPAVQPHEYERGGTAKLLTLFRPATGIVRAKGVLSAPNAVLHPWLKEQLSEVLAEIEKKSPQNELPPEAERPLYAQWETWLGHPPRGKPLPPLRIILVLDNLAGHLSYDLVQWFFEHGVMPLYTPVGGSWLNMAESVQRIIVRRALAGQHPKSAQEVIDWLEQSVAGWNEKPTPFVWNGKRRRRRERARLRRLGGSAASIAKGYSIAS